MDRAPDRVLVVGGGLAGAHTALALRDAGYQGELTLLGDEPRPPYDRPPLSKGVLAAADVASEADPTLPIDLAALAVTTRLGERALALDASRRVVVTSAGVELAYDALVAATGATPIALPGTDLPGAGLPARDSGPDPAVRTLRTLDDARALRASFAPGRRLVIVGAGWIGAEVATAARAAGCDVTVVEAAERPLAGALPAGVGARFAAWYRRAGVDLRVDSPVDGVAASGVRLVGSGSESSWLPADEVLVAVGVRPATAWLAGPAGLTLCPDGGVPVDSGLRTELPDVYAVGDIAAYASGRYGVRVRSEHWDNALRGPRVVAANLLGGAESHDPVPYVWSEQFGHMVQYLGRHDVGDLRVERAGANDDDADWSVCWLAATDAGHVLRAVLAVDRPRDFTQARRLIDAGTPVDPERIADPATPLRATAT